MLVISRGGSGDGFWRSEDLVAAGLYDDEQSVMRDAMRALLAERPQLRLEVAIYRFGMRHVRRAAALAGVSWERMREIGESRLRLRLGAGSEAEVPGGNPHHGANRAEDTD